MGNDIPSKQKAAVKQGDGGDAKAPVQEVDVPQKPGPGQILVKINWTGLCASDKSLIHDEWAGFGFKMQDATKGIAGHEGAGVVAAVHPDVEDIWKVGDRAGVKWVVSVCRICEFCTNGTDELQCPQQKNSGFSMPGTFQEYVLTDGRYCTRLPEGVTDEEAGPIMCGGVTAYTACKRSACRPGQWCVILGAGGGLGHFGVQYANAMGMRVIAIDAGDDKRKLCIDKLKAEKYIDFTQEKDITGKVTEITKYGAHGCIVYSSAKEGYAVAPSLIRPGGTVVAVGLPTDTSVMAGSSPLDLALKRKNIVGSVTGTLKDVEECLEFTARGLVHPILTKGTLEDVDKFIDLMKHGQLPGRAVLKIGA